MASPDVRAAMRSLDQALTDAHFAHTKLPKSHIRSRMLIVNAEDLIAEAWTELKRGNRAKRRSRKKQS